MQASVLNLSSAVGGFDSLDRPAAGSWSVDGHLRRVDAGGKVESQICGGWMDAEGS